MITTKTGAKKLEANDNWAKIVPNAQGQDSAHNDSVEAHDDAIESLCQTISGTTNNCGHTINSGEYFIANGGKYKATASIPVNQAWSGSAQAVSDNDLINALNNSFNDNFITGVITSGTGWTLYGIGKIRIFNAIALAVPASGLDIIPSGHRPNKMVQVYGAGVDLGNHTPIGMLITQSGVLLTSSVEDGLSVSTQDLRGVLVWGIG